MRVKPNMNRSVNTRLSSLFPFWSVNEDLSSILVSKYALSFISECIDIILSDRGINAYPLLQSVTIFWKNNNEDNAIENVVVIRRCLVVRVHDRD